MAKLRKIPPLADYWLMCSQSLRPCIAPLATHQAYSDLGDVRVMQLQSLLICECGYEGGT